MQKPQTFRKYAEECRRLARSLPAEHRATLLMIADAWTACAEEEERKQKARGSKKRETDDPAPPKWARPPPHDRPRKRQPFSLGYVACC
jgi:hypothetical protein